MTDYRGEEAKSYFCHNLAKPTDLNKKTWAAYTAQFSSIKKIAYPNSLNLFANSMDNTAAEGTSPKAAIEFLKIFEQKSPLGN